jgi:RHS repeat-associated protein
LDTATELYNNRARYYDPATGRPLSQDPLGFNAGDSNLYRYVNNAPTNATDPSGLCEDEDELEGVDPEGFLTDEPGQTKKTNPTNNQTTVPTSPINKSQPVEQEPISRIPPAVIIYPGGVISGRNPNWYPRSGPGGPNFRTPPPVIVYPGGVNPGKNPNQYPRSGPGGPNFPMPPPVIIYPGGVNPGKSPNQYPRSGPGGPGGELEND